MKCYDVLAWNECGEVKLFFSVIEKIMTQKMFLSVMVVVVALFSS